MKTSFDTAVVFIQVGSAGPSPGVIWQCLGHFCQSLSWCYWHLLASKEEAKDAAQHPTMRRTAAHSTESPGKCPECQV